MMTLLNLHNWPLRTRLIWGFLLLSLGPFVLSAIWLVNSFTQHSEEQVLNHLVSVRNIKHTQIEDYLNTTLHSARQFASTEFAQNSIGRFYGFSRAWQQLGLLQAQLPSWAGLLNRRQYAELSSRLGAADAAGTSDFSQGAFFYLQVHERFHDGYLKFIEDTDFDDILLLNLEGQVLYSPRKDAYFGRHLQTLKSPLWPAFNEMREQLKQQPIEQVQRLIDFRYDPISDQIRAWVLLPIHQYGHLSGILAFSLPHTHLNALMGARQGLGEKGETYLVGPDKLMRSDSYLQPGSFSVQASLRQQQHLDSAAIRAGLAGQSGTATTLSYLNQQVLSAWAPLQVEGLHWVLVADMDLNEAHQKANELRRLTLAIALLIALVLILIAFWLSASISEPIDRLIHASEQLAQGRLDYPLLVSHQPAEMARLARSFAHMRDAIRNNIALIRQQNQELAEQLQVIDQQNQELQESNRLKDNFLAITSHELRTPLHAIIGLADSLEKGGAGATTEGQRHNLSLISSSARRLARLVNDLLDLHRLKQQGLQVQPESLEIQAVIQSVLSQCQPLLVNKPLQLDCQFPSSPLRVLADPARLEQILYNLLGNAIKFTPQGQIGIRLEAQQQQVVVHISDTGPGLTASEQERIFEPLVQLEAVMTRTQAGSGLGLPIARQLVELQGGKLWLSSAPGQGSTFSFSLPLSQAPSQAWSPQLFQHEIEPQLLPPPVSCHQGPCILVVDDEVLNLQVLHNFLAPHFQVHSCQDSRQALAEVQRLQPQLVILDVMMPHLDGIALCRLLRQHYDAAELSILLLTALPQLEHRLQGFAAGANDYLLKPLEQAELLARIQAQLSYQDAASQKQINQQLAAEIEQRKAAQQRLQQSRDQLLSLLESSGEAFICLDQSGQIQLYAARSQALLGGELSDNQIDDWLLQPSWSELQSSLQQGPQLSQLCWRTTSGEQSLPTWLEAQDQGYTLILNPGSQEARQLLRHTLAALPDEPATDPQQEYRLQVVEVMRLSLELWIQAGGKNKLELAEQSGIWKVYLDRSSLQTRTLDKYFSLDTLPTHPRWRDVLATAEFVQKRCAERLDCQALLVAMQRLRELLPRR
ncbi:ATP-binding protein [Balneatrix alpica]|uniref:ATP-binding protein n=1 Tax=Balneatrix alpica TaxID=75684 RepID=UPI0027393DD6|nr:ATP-binding protein [Balneatrix alpica]